MEVTYWHISGLIIASLIFGAFLFGQGQVIRLDDMERSSINGYWKTQISLAEKKCDNFITDTALREQENKEDITRKINRYSYLAITNFCNPIKNQLIDLNKSIFDENGLKNDINKMIKDKDCS